MVQNIIFSAYFLEADFDLLWYEIESPQHNILWEFSCFAFINGRNVFPGITARAIFDYQAADTDEISFNKDDIIIKIERVKQGWWRGTDLCTVDIANVSLAWEIHAKQRTDLLEDEITSKIKEFVKGQDVKKQNKRISYGYNATTKNGKTIWVG